MLVGHMLTCKQIKDFVTAIELHQQNEAKVCVKGMRKGRNLSDVFFTVGMSVFETLLFRRAFWDVNAQPNLISREFFESLKQPPTDFSFDLFIYFHIKKHKIKLVRFPVIFGIRKFGVSSWNVDFASKVKFIKRTLDFSIMLYKRERNANHLS